MTRPSKPETEAARLLRELEITRPPTPVERIARSLKIRVSKEPFEGNVSGMLTRVGKRAVIGVNSWQSPTRQRFTVAHELGHFVLHPAKPTFIDHVRVDYRDERSQAGTHRQEIEANSFAAALLMPEDLVREHVRRQLRLGSDPTGDELVVSLAARFNVSPEAMSHRLTNLGINLQI